MVEFEDFIDDIQRLDQSASEIHGVLSGFLCAGGMWEEASDEELEMLLNNADGQLVRGLLDEVNGQLGAMNMDFVPLVPSDEHPMDVRLAALSEWCGGFLSGYGLGVGDERLDQTTREMLQDLLAIAELDPDDDDSEENEVDFTEVYEYARVVALTLHGAAVGTPREEDDG